MGDKSLSFYFIPRAQNLSDGEPVTIVGNNFKIQLGYINLIK